MINDQDFRQFQYNVLGIDSKITGELSLKGHTIITASIEGTLEIRDTAKLILERGSVIKGKIKAHDLEIFGQVIGEIECTGLVSIRSNAQVHGSIKAARLTIYPGAVVEMNVSSEETPTEQA